ncbi:hypothetical protein [Desulfobacter sp. UBA2225]|uniref:hypothetical protein n=1 Tax=Desulfobacter sp. UBA2225 TaxID=1961413 RepID=UPI00257A5C7A|nr:hypothetical protein [Desulfobacter sp. UBA2225]
MVYYFLFAAIIRGSKEVKIRGHGAHYIYEKHFLQGQLVSRYSQEKMAEYLETSQSRISKYIKELAEDDFIKIIERKTAAKGIILYYQFGTWEGQYEKDTYKETIWLDDYFSKKYLENKETRHQKTMDQVYTDLMEPYDDLDEFLDFIENLRPLEDEEKEQIEILWEKNKGPVECLI